MAVKNVLDGHLDRSLIGASVTEKFAFWGKTPVIQPTATAQSAMSTTAVTTLVTTPTATDIATVVNAVIARQEAVVTLVNRLRADLVTVGIIKGS